MKVLGIIKSANGVKNYFTYNPGNNELKLNRKNFPLNDNVEYPTILVYQDYNDYSYYYEFDKYLYPSTYLDHFLTQLKKSKAKLDIRGFDFTDQEKELGINYIKANYPVSYEFCKDEFTTENFEWIIEYEYDDNLEYAIETGEGYLEGYTGVYGNNDLYELIDGFVGMIIQNNFYENEEFATEYVKACLENDFGTPEYDILYLDYDILDYVDKERYKRIKEYYNIKNKIQRELWFIEHSQKELLKLKHGESYYSAEFTKELIHNHLRSIPKAQENIKEYKRELRRFKRIPGSQSCCL